MNWKLFVAYVAERKYAFAKHFICPFPLKKRR